MKTIVKCFGLVVVLVALVGCGTNNLDVAKEEAVARQREAAADIAQTLPDLARENYSGQSILEIAKANASISTTLSQAMIDLATQDMRARDEWRMFEMAALLLILFFGGAFGLPAYVRHTIKMREIARELADEQIKAARAADACRQCAHDSRTRPL